MAVGGCLCALRALGWGKHVSVEYIYLYWIYSANIWGIYGSWRVSVRPSGAGLGNKKIIKKISMVSNCTRCQIVRFYTWCQIVRGVKLSWCQIVRCQIVRGVKLSGVKLSWCQIVRQHGRCQIVRGVKLSWCQIVLAPAEIEEPLKQIYSI